MLATSVPRRMPSTDALLHEAVPWAGSVTYTSVLMCPALLHNVGNSRSETSRRIRTVTQKGRKNGVGCPK